MRLVREKSVDGDYAGYLEYQTRELFEQFVKATGSRELAASEIQRIVEKETKQ